MPRDKDSVRFRQIDIVTDDIKMLQEEVKNLKKEIEKINLILSKLNYEEVIDENVNSGWWYWG
tara:strand:- start:3066 stop:3254 length:189 start_codon:yes stop_codon:yes gene_type:complete